MILSAIVFAAVGFTVCVVIGVVGFFFMQGMRWFMDYCIDHRYGGWIMPGVVGGFIFLLLFGLGLLIQAGG